MKMHVPPTFPRDFMNYSRTEIALKLRLGLEKEWGRANAKLETFLCKRDNPKNRSKYSYNVARIK